MFVDSKIERFHKSTQKPNYRAESKFNSTPQGHKRLENEGTSSKIPPIDDCQQEGGLDQDVTPNLSNFNPYYVNSSLLNICSFQSTTRSKMVLWFIEESSNQFLPRVVCSRAICLLDWFLMRGIKIQITELQQYGIACLGLAWKMNESGIGIIPVDEANFKKKNIVAFERHVLESLKFMIQGPTYISIALEILNCWDEYMEEIHGKTKNLPIYLTNIKDDECKDLGAVLRIDQIFSIIDLCSSVLEFLDHRPQDVIFNILFFFVKIYRHWPNTFSTIDSDLLSIFDEFNKRIPEQGLHPIGEMNIIEILQTKIAFIYDTFCKERQLQSDRNPQYRDWDYLKNFFVQFCVKESKEINLDDNYEKARKRKIIRKGRKTMNLLETIVNIQVSKPYYSKIARSLLKNLQCLRQ